MLRCTGTGRHPVVVELVFEREFHAADFAWPARCCETCVDEFGLPCLGGLESLTGRGRTRTLPVVVEQCGQPVAPVAGRCFEYRRGLLFHRATSHDVRTRIVCRSRFFGAPLAEPRADFGAVGTVRGRGFGLEAECVRERSARTFL